MHLSMHGKRVGRLQDCVCVITIEILPERAGDSKRNIFSAKFDIEERKADRQSVNLCYGRGTPGTSRWRRGGG